MKQLSTCTHDEIPAEIVEAWAKSAAAHSYIMGKLERLLESWREFYRMFYQVGMGLPGIATVPEWTESRWFTHDRAKDIGNLQGDAAIEWVQANVKPDLFDEHGAFDPMQMTGTAEDAFIWEAFDKRLRSGETLTDALHNLEQDIRRAVTETVDYIKSPQGLIDEQIARDLYLDGKELFRKAGRIYIPVELAELKL